MIEERLTNLEIKFAHQDEFINELNKIVVEQQKTIERLDKEILDLKRNVNAHPTDNIERLKDEKPPHY